MKLLPLLLTVPALFIAPEAFARPVYAIQEGKQCGYCHVNPKGGGARNPRGEYYAAHHHTFQGYDEAKVMGQYAQDLFKVAWQETVPASVHRIAVGDTVGDGTSRLVLLSEGPTKESRTVSVRKWDGKAWNTEFTTDAADGQDRLAVGKYSATGPADIVTAGALWFWNGKTYEKRPAPRPLDIIGTALLQDGSQRLMLKEGDALRLYRVDTTASGSDWLTGPSGMPASSQLSFSDMKAPTAELMAIGLPDQLAGGGIVGLWNAPKPQAMYLYTVQIVPLVDVAKQNAQELIAKGQEDHLVVADPRLTLYKTLWLSQKLEGPVLDVALGDPRSGARGLTVLTGGSEDGKGHTLYFFQLE